MQGHLLTLLALALSGCASMGPAIEDWPELEVIEHHVPRAQVHERCRKYAAFGSRPLACAEVDFAARRCDIWLSAESPPAAYVLRHERQHCAGHDHEGESSLRDALALHRSRPAALAGAAYPAP